MVSYGNGGGGCNSSGWRIFLAVVASQVMVSLVLLPFSVESSNATNGTNGTVWYYCSAGKYGNRSDVELDLACSMCEPGHFCPGSTNGLVPCPPGRFGNVPNQTNQSFACTNVCGAGRYGGVSGGTIESNACPSLCPVGKFGNENRTGQTNVTGACPNACSAGTYGNATGRIRESAACAYQCPGGKYGAGTGQSEVGLACPHVCPSGKFGNGTGSTAEATACDKQCPPGRYGNVTGKTTELGACPGVCSSGRFGNVHGKVAELDACPSRCAPGRYGGASEVGKRALDEACPNLCPPGRWGTVAGTFAVLVGCSNVCPGGKYGAVAGKTTEQAACPSRCPGGKYGNFSGETTETGACKLCPAGKFGNFIGSTSLVAACPHNCSAGRYGNVTGQRLEEGSCTQFCTAGTWGNVSGATSFSLACGNVCPIGRYGHKIGSISAEEACGESFALRVVNTNGVNVVRNKYDPNQTRYYFNHFTEPTLRIHWDRPNKTDQNHSILTIVRWPPLVHHKYCTQTWGQIYIPPCDENASCVKNQTVDMPMPWLHGTYNVTLWRWRQDKADLANITKAFDTYFDGQGGDRESLYSPPWQVNHTKICDNYTDFYGTNRSAVLAAYEPAISTSFFVQPAINIVAGGATNADNTQVELEEGGDLSRPNDPFPQIQLQMNAGPSRFTNDGRMTLQIDGKNCFSPDAYLNEAYARLTLNGELLNVADYNITNDNWRSSFNGTWQTIGTIDNVHQEGAFNCKLRVYLLPASGDYRHGWDDVASVYTMGGESVRLPVNNREGEVMLVDVPVRINDDDVTWWAAQTRDTVADALRWVILVVLLWRILASLAWAMIDTWDLRDANNKAHISVAGARSPVCETKDRRYHHVSIWFVLWTLQCTALVGHLRFVQDYGTAYGPFATRMLGVFVLDNMPDVGSFRVPWPNVDELPVQISSFPDRWSPAPPVPVVHNKTATVPNASIPMCGNYTLAKVQSWYDSYDKKVWNYSLYVPTFNSTNQTTVVNCTRKMCGNTTFDVAERYWKASNRTSLPGNVSLYDALILDENKTLLSCNNTVIPYRIDCLNDGMCYGFHLAGLFSPLQVQAAQCEENYCKTNGFEWNDCDRFCSWLPFAERRLPSFYNRSHLNENATMSKCPCITPPVVPSPSPLPPIDIDAMIEPFHNFPVLDGLEREYYPEALLQHFMGRLLWSIILVSVVFVARFCLSALFRYQMRRWVKEFRDCPVFTSRINVMVGGIVNLKVMTGSEVKEMKRRLKTLQVVQSEAAIAAGLAGQSSTGRLAKNNANGLEAILERFYDYAHVQKYALVIFMAIVVPLSHGASFAITTERDGFTGVSWGLLTVFFFCICAQGYFYFSYAESRMLFKDANLPETLQEAKHIGLETEELRLLSIAHASKFGTWIVSGKDRHWKERYGSVVLDYLYMRPEQREFRPYLYGIYNMWRMFLYSIVIGALPLVDANGATQAWAALLLQLFHTCVLAILRPYNDRNSNGMAIFSNSLMILVVFFSFCIPSTETVKGESIFGSSPPLSRYSAEFAMCICTMLAVAPIIGSEIPGMCREIGGIMECVFNSIMTRVRRMKWCRRHAAVYAIGKSDDGAEKKKADELRKKQKLLEKQKKKEAQKKKLEEARKAAAKSKKTGGKKEEIAIVLEEEESSEDEDAEDPEDEIQRLKAELASEGFEYGGANFSEEDLAAHATTASRKAVLQWVRKEMEPLGKKTYRAGGVTKRQEKKDLEIKQELKDKKAQVAQKKELEMMEYKEEMERRQNMKVSMHLASNRGIDDRQMDSYDALR